MGRWSMGRWWTDDFEEAEGYADQLEGGRVLVAVVKTLDLPSKEYLEEHDHGLAFGRVPRPRRGVRVIQPDHPRDPAGRFPMLPLLHPGWSRLFRGVGPAEASEYPEIPKHPETTHTRKGKE